MSMEAYLHEKEHEDNGKKMNITSFATNVISLDNVCDPVERMCKWWNPAKQEVKVYGRMCFRAGLESEIRLFDTCYEQRADLLEQGADCMVGITDRTECVSAFNAVPAGAHFSSNWNVEAETSVAHLTFLDAWIGQRQYDAKASVKFDSLFVALNGIIEWLDVKCTRASSIMGRQESMSFVAPEPVLLFENNDVAVYVVVRADKANKDLSTIRYIGGVQIESKKGVMPFYGATNSFEYWYDVCYSFLGTLIGRHVVILDCIGSVCDGRPYGERIELRRLWCRDVNLRMLKKVNADEVRYPYDIIKEDLASCFAAYLKLSKRVASEISHLVYLQTCSFSLSRSVLPNLCFMFEGLQGELFANENKLVVKDEREETEAMIRLLGEGRDNVVQQWLEKHVRVHVTLDQRFKVVWDEVGAAVYPYFKPGQVGALIKYIKYRRNGYAHGFGGFGFVDEFRLYMFVVFWFWTFMGVMVLVRCGLSIKVACKCLSRVRCDYGETARNLCNLLQAASSHGDCK